MQPLYDIPLLASLKPADAALLQERLKPRSFRKGENVLLPGQIQHEIYFVLRGVQMAYLDTPAKMQVIGFTHTGMLGIIPETFAFPVLRNLSARHGCALFDF